MTLPRGGFCPPCSKKGFEPRLIRECVLRRRRRRRRREVEK